MLTTMATLSCLLLLLLHSFTSTTAQSIQKCEGGNYTANSTYQSNLQLLLSSLSSSNSTFANSTKGSSPDRVYGLVLCRGDLDPSSCQSCYENMSQNITQLCEYSKQAVIWERECELRYSDINFFSSLDVPQVVTGLYNEKTAPDSDTFSNMSKALFKSVMSRAAHNSSIMLATGLSNYSDDTIYSLAQCTRDLTPDICEQCLQQVLDFYWGCCRTNIGGWYLEKSCNYRYY